MKFHFLLRFCTRRRSKTHIFFLANCTQNHLCILFCSRHLSLCQELNLAYNNLNEISALMLEGLYSLEELDLSYNSLTLIQTGSFADLPELEVLSLTGKPADVLQGGCVPEWRERGPSPRRAGAVVGREPTAL